MLTVELAAPRSEAATVRQLAINAAAAQPRASHADRPMPLLDVSRGHADV